MFKVGANTTQMMKEVNRIISLHKTTTSGCGSYEPLVQANFLLTSLKLASKTLTFTHMYFLFLAHENRIEKRRKIITLFFRFAAFKTNEVLSIQ